MTLRISIIIPVYNVEQYIEECLMSVTNQTMTEGIECIIVDDCGQDNSATIAKHFVDSYQGDIRCTVIQREKNGGLSAARNTGIEAATGEYVYFLDSDDYLVPSAIETLISIADRNGGVDLLPALYITNAGHHMNQFGGHSFPEFSDNQKIIKCALLDYDRIPVTAANRLIRRLLIIDNALWFKEGIIHEDNYWTFFLAKHVKRMAFCPEKLYFYRETPGSITKSKNTENEVLAFKTMVRDFTANIDDFERGAQKRYIFLHILSLDRYKDYIDTQEWKDMLRAFLHSCSLAERIVFGLTMTSKGYVRQKSINLLQKLFLKR